MSTSTLTNIKYKYKYQVPSTSSVIDTCHRSSWHRWQSETKANRHRLMNREYKSMVHRRLYAPSDTPWTKNSSLTPAVVCRTGRNHCHAACRKQQWCLQGPDPQLDKNKDYLPPTKTYTITFNEYWTSMSASHNIPQSSPCITCESIRWHASQRYCIFISQQPTVQYEGLFKD